MQESFEWDEAKNQENQAKHGVSFEEAQQAFLDPHGVMFEDELHSTLEETRYFGSSGIQGLTSDPPIKIGV